MVMLSPHQPSMKIYGCPVQLTLQGFTTAVISHLCLHLMVRDVHGKFFIGMMAYYQTLIVVIF